MFSGAGAASGYDPDLGHALPLDDASIACIGLRERRENTRSRGAPPLPAADQPLLHRRFVGGFLHARPGRPPGLP